jgi:hypothetical protein
MPNVTLICKLCSYKARRPLMNEAGCRGVHETASEPASCPNGHGLLVREDGLQQEKWAAWRKNPDSKIVDT